MPTEQLINELQSYGIRLVDPGAGHESRRGGAGPSDHKAVTIDGMTVMVPAGNDWHDVATGERVYCVEDPRHPIIGKEVTEETMHAGTSPRNLTSSTIGDELIIASGGRSRVFSVSIKDRGAILPGGQLGKAFWYSSGSGKFVTSTYYYSDYPE